MLIRKSYEDVEKSFVKEHKKGWKGKPHTKLDLSKLEYLMVIQCTQQEIADMLEMHIDTLRDLIPRYYTNENNEKYTYSKLYKEMLSKGLCSLRRSQWKKAIDKDNTTMQIWLGKQYLNQSDKAIIQETDTDATTVEYDVRESMYNDEKGKEKNV